MYKVTYLTDTTTAAPSGANLSSSRYGIAATSSSSAGYFGGGTIGLNSYSTMDKLTYISETTAAVPGAALSAGRPNLAATASTTAGYFGGGFGTGPLSTMDKLTYSSDTTAAVPGAALSIARSNFAATGSLTAGYFGGGINPSLTGTYTTMDKVTYSTDTTAAVPGAALSLVRYRLAATGSSTAGYFGGGFNGPNYTTMDKVTY